MNIKLIRFTLNAFFLTLSVAVFAQHYQYYPYGGQGTTPFTVPNDIDSAANLENVWNDDNVMLTARFDQVSTTLPASISQDSSKTYVNEPDGSTGNSNITARRTISETDPFSRSFAWNPNPETYEQNYGVGFNFTVRFAEAGKYNPLLRIRANTNGGQFLLEFFDSTDYDGGAIKTININTAGIGYGNVLGDKSTDESAEYVAVGKSPNTTPNANSYWLKVLVDTFEIDAPKTVIFRLTQDPSYNGSSHGGFTFFKVPEDNPDNINNISALNVDMYPNPANNELFVNLSDLAGVAQINVFTLSGKSVISQQVEAGKVAKLNVAELSGIYLVKIESNAGSFVQKLIVE